MDKQQRRFTLKAKILLVVWAFVCLLLFLLLRFPYDMFKPGIEDIMSGFAGTPVTMGEMHGVFPLGLKATDVRIKDETLAASLTVRPDWLGIFIGRAGVSFKLEQVKGSVQGSIRTSLIHPGQSLAVALNFDNYDLTSMRSIIKNSAVEVLGLLNGKIAFKTTADKFKESTGVISLNVKQGQMNFMMRDVAAASFPFDDFIFESKIEKGILAIIKGELYGKDLSGNLKGNIKLANRFNNSELKISGNMKIPAAYRSMIGLRGENADIRLNGRISRPYLSLREGTRIIFQTR